MSTESILLWQKELKDQMWYATELQVYAEPKPEGKQSTPGAGNSNLLLKLKERVFKTHSMFWMSVINLKSTFCN